MERRSIGWVRIRVGHQTLEISWEARQELLERLRRIPSAASLADLFERHGTSNLVIPAAGELRLLRDVVWHWMEEVRRDVSATTSRSCGTRSSTASARREPPRPPPFSRC